MAPVDLSKASEKLCGAFVQKSRVVTVADDALEVILSFLDKQNLMALVICVDDDRGCAGKKYNMYALNREEYGDGMGFHVLYSNENRLVVLREDSILYTAGMHIEYTTDNVGGGGFVFRNPNAKNTCGCGESFNTEESE